MHPNDEIMRYYEPEKIIDTKYTVKEFIESLEQKGLLSQIDNTTFLDNIAKQHNPDSHYSTFSTVTYDSYTEDGKTYNSRLIIIRSDDGTDILLPGLFLGDNKRARKENLGLCITIDKDLEQSTFQIDESGVLTPVDARNEILEEIHKAQEILIKEDPYEIELRKDLAQRLHAQYVGMFGDNPSTFAKMSDNEYVLIDREGNTIRDNIYRYKPFSEGLAVVGTKDGWGYLKPDGTILYTKVKFYEADSFSEGLALVKTENSWGYLKPDGTLLPTRIEFSEAGSFSEGLAVVGTKDGWGYLKPDGTILHTEVKIYEADYFSEGLAVVWTKDGLGYLNTDGTILHTEVKIKSARPFSDGLSLVRTKDGLGYLKTDGTILYTKVKFYEADSFSEGLAVVRTKDGLGYLKTDGTILYTKVKFYEADSFSEGLAVVKTENGWGYLNTDGTILHTEVKIYKADSFSDGVAQVTSDGMRLFIDHSGNKVF